MTRDEVMAVPCPACGAKVGQGCETYRGNLTFNMHASRKASAVADAIIHFAPPAPPGDKG